jgi:hypothetical protein
LWQRRRQEVKRGGSGRVTEFKSLSEEINAETLRFAEKRRGM